MKNPGRKEREFFEKNYLRLLTTSTWSYDPQKLAKGAEIVWRVPIRDLRDVHDRPLPVQKLDGTAVRAKLDLVAVVPDEAREMVTSNARQNSTAITVPVNAGAAQR